MTDGSCWTHRSYHRDWLLRQANGLFDFFQPNIVDPKGGFLDLDDEGNPLDSMRQVRHIHVAARMVHCFALGMLLGRPGASALVDHGMSYLWKFHRDAAHGGYFTSLDDRGPVDRTKQGYGHAFVLLAAASAKTVGHPLADAMLVDILDILNTKFWEERHGAIAEEFTEDWRPLNGGAYRGQNSNMHLCEALMAAFEVTGDPALLAKAESIADLVIRRSAASVGWRVPEHFDADWRIDEAYRHPDEMLRPAGTTPGHWLEWSRLILQLWVLGGRRNEWMPNAAQHLFSQAFALGWDEANGGFFYTLDWNDTPAIRSKFWWPACEAVAAAHFLNAHVPSGFHQASYRRVWDIIDRNFIDHENGGWHEELTEDLHPATSLFRGKGDIYHAMQACLVPFFSANGSLTLMITRDAASAL